MPASIELKIPSTFVNILNFLIFDVALITLVYVLTADVMGRLNDRTLRDGNPHRLYIACPPVLGGGLCSTNCLRALLLFLARLIGLGLILASELTIKGESRGELFTTSGKVLTHGNISALHDVGSFDDNVFLRASCQGSRIKGGRTTMYYGELREVQKKGQSTYECVTDPALLSGKVFEFDRRLLTLNVTTGDACTARIRTDGRNESSVHYICPHASLICVLPSDSGEPKLESCRGVLRHQGETYLAEHGAAWPQMPVEPTDLRWVSGIDHTDPFWLDSNFSTLADMKSIIDASSVSSLEKRVVRKRRKVEWTVINPLWFAALVLKVLLVFVLMVFSTVLKRSGFRTVAHDEERLTSMLNTMVEEKSWPQRRRTDFGSGSIFINALRSADGLLVTADSHPRREAPTLETGRNSDLNRLEAMYI